MIFSRLIAPFLFSVLFSAKSCFAQQAAFNLFAEDQFKGIQIYDVIQDSKNHYYFATNEGIFRYNFIEFEKVSNPSAKSNSVYNFIKTSDHIIYCNNLNNQVFRIKDGKCTLVYEIDPKDARADINLIIGEKDELLVYSKQIVVINKQGKVEQLYRDIHSYLGPPTKLVNGEIVFHEARSNSILTYHNGKFIKKNTKITADVLSFFYCGDKLYGLDIATKKCFSISLPSFSLSEIVTPPAFLRSQSIRTYPTQNGLWLAGTLPGVVYQKEAMTDGTNPVFYSNYFISDVFVDHEGNTLLSTFDHGVLVIPDLSINDVLNTFEQDPINMLHSLNKNQLLFGSAEGKIIRYSNNKLDTLHSLGKRPIEVMASNDNYLIFDDGTLRFYDLSTKQIHNLFQASLKSAQHTKGDHFFLGTNLGLFSIELSKNGRFTASRIDELKLRVHRLAYEKMQKLLAISNTEGLLVRKENGSILKLKDKGKDIYPNDFLFYDEKLYVATRSNEILVFAEGKIIKRLPLACDGKSFSAKKLVIQNKSIYVSSTNGLFKMQLDGKNTQAIHSLFGFSFKRIFDFTFHNSTLWVSHAGGVQALIFKQKTAQKCINEIYFDRVLANGKSIDFSNEHNLNNNQRNIQFYFTLPSIRNQEKVVFHYRLIGADPNWSILSTGNNQITFSALSSGKYTFEIKAQIQDDFGKTIRYSFEIDAPFYQKWWFVSLTIIGFLATVYLIYRRQLSIQKRKSKLINELHASKLTAIQSQMNPHFIFNSLNSIQDLVLKKDTQNSYTYITTFSNLVRRTLNYSEKDFIEFEQEVKLLELYLSLEKLRFKQELTYQIDTQQIDDILIPPLLIQPFIENALVHGLLHKEGEKKLSVIFELSDKLICTIVDNGIGRNEAKEIRQRQRGEHESFSTEAIKKRFEILSELMKGSFGFHYEDLEENGKSTGTKVKIEIPFKPKY